MGNSNSNQFQIYYEFGYNNGITENIIYWMNLKNVFKYVLYKNVPNLIILHLMLQYRLVMKWK